MNENHHEKRFILLAVLVALLSVAGGVGLWKYRASEPTEAFEALLVLPEPRVLGDFALTDVSGEPFTLAQLSGRWSLLFFGFTHCPDICPSTLYDLQQVRQAVGDADGTAPWQVVFVSVDSERDTPERLRDYVSWFDPDFIAVTGDDAQLRPLAMRMGVAYRIEEHAPGAANYAVDHSASVFLTDPSGRLHGVFPAPHDAAAMARDLAAILERDTAR